MKRFFLLLLLVGLFSYLFQSRLAFSVRGKIISAKVVAVVNEEVEDNQLYQQLELVTDQGEKLQLKTEALPLVSGQKYRAGDRLLIESVKTEDGQTHWQIFDYYRQPFLSYLFVFFIILVIVIARVRGLSSLLGMALSFLVIFYLLLPELMAGSNPVFVALIGSLILIPVTFFLSHGLNLKTITAIAGTLVALALTAGLAYLSVHQAHLSGFVSEEAGFLQDLTNGRFSPQGLLLAGIILSLVGILDDITISQAAIVFELKRANPELSRSQLYWRAMRVGQDHIASMVNTLILVYTGAALPLFLLFFDSQRSLGQVVNSEIIAEEVVRSLVTSIGLILAVPITTFLAVLMAKNH